MVSADPDAVGLEAEEGAGGMHDLGNSKAILKESACGWWPCGWCVCTKCVTRLEKVEGWQGTMGR